MVTKAISRLKGSIRSMTGRFAITWLGHGTFILTTPGGARIVIDPWLEGNPRCPPQWKRVSQAELILVTHGHHDHVGDLVQTARATSAPVVAVAELCRWLETKGLQRLLPMNKGGTLSIDDVQVTMVPAEHSSGWLERGAMVYVGEPVGYVLTLENGLKLYFAGDTAVFGDMRLIREMYSPSIAFLPIGDRFTMGPDGAARACELLGVRQVVPMHYGTFPSLTGTPDRLRELLAGKETEVLELEPGETAS